MTNVKSQMPNGGEEKRVAASVLNSNIRMTIVWSQLMVNMQHAIFIVGETGRLFGSKDFPHKVALFSHLLTPFMGVFFG